MNNIYEPLLFKQIELQIFPFPIVLSTLNTPLLPTPQESALTHAEAIREFYKNN